MPLAEPGGDDFRFDHDDRDSTSWDGDQTGPVTARGRRGSVGKGMKTHCSVQSMFEIDGSLKARFKVPAVDGEEEADEVQGPKRLPSGASKSSADADGQNSMRFHDVRALHSLVSLPPPPLSLSLSLSLSLQSLPLLSLLPLPPHSPCPHSFSPHSLPPLCCPPQPCHIAPRHRYTVLVRARHADAQAHALTVCTVHT